MDPLMLLCLAVIALSSYPLTRACFATPGQNKRRKINRHAQKAAHSKQTKQRVKRSHSLHNTQKSVEEWYGAKNSRRMPRVQQPTRRAPVPQHFYLSDLSPQTQRLHS